MLILPGVQFGCLTDHLRRTGVEDNNVVKSGAIRQFGSEFGIISRLQPISHNDGGITVGNLEPGSSGPGDRTAVYREYATDRIQVNAYGSTVSGTHAVKGHQACTVAQRESETAVGVDCDIVYRQRAAAATDHACTRAGDVETANSIARAQRDCRAGGIGDPR